MNDKRYYRIFVWLIPLVLVCAAFVFMQCCYPYHLFRREQTMLMLMDSEFIGNYLAHLGWLSALVGDFLTQFFYYVGLGATIISLMLGLLWLEVWVCVKHLTSNRALPLLAATLVTVWEFFRECGDTYSLDSTIALAGALALLIPVVKIHNRYIKAAMAAMSIALGYWCFGYAYIIVAVMAIIIGLLQRQWMTCVIGIAAVLLIPKAVIKNVQWWGWPNFVQERKLAIDSEAYFGNWHQVLNLTLNGAHTKYSSLYYYLINAMAGDLPDAVLTRMPKDADGLIPTMDPGKNSIDLSALSDLWYYMGDMTAAEHCTIVAMISSSRYTGSRYIRRLAEINLAKGDDEAAAKYLRLLSKTLCHRRWAMSRMPGRESEAAKSMREDAAKYIVDSDTIRFVNDYTKSIRHLVNGHNDNGVAYDFLQCHNLLRRDIKAFVDDLDMSRPLPRLYQEALLIYLSIINADTDDVARYNISDPVLEDFYNFNQLMPITDANRHEAANRFGNTYWYFYQLQQQ